MYEQRLQIRIVASLFAQSNPKKVSPAEFNCRKSFLKVSFSQQGQTILGTPIAEYFKKITAFRLKI